MKAIPAKHPHKNGIKFLRLPQAQTDVSAELLDDALTFPPFSTK
jgi:hypothetical protein